MRGIAAASAPHSAMTTSSGWFARSSKPLLARPRSVLKLVDEFAKYMADAIVITITMIYNGSDGLH